ncbi:hypothetical protein [Methyloprofundus sp.]|uniref:hypothetical protein n=1 Tax=Methyloprofundus sp. TaxID=2020875 RepID=UPI003D1000BD
MAIEKASDARINEVAQLGKQVMPFDLNQTLHVFSKVKDGGVQRIRLDCDREASHNLNRLLDKPGTIVGIHLMRSMKIAFC